MRHFLILLFGFLVFSGNVQAQNETPQFKSIKGFVKDSISRPVEGAVVILLNSSDSTLVKTTFSEADGSFVVDGISIGNYFIYITHEEFNDFSGPAIPVTEVQSETSISVISLSKKAVKELQEMKVIAKIPVVVRKLDRTVVNVDAMISAAGNNVLELLGKSPGVLVDANGGITLKGKSGVQIYIDDKPTYLSGDALQNLLRSMSLSSVCLFEFITNPPAKYDAAGNSGIINIVTKKSKVKGFNGSFSVSYGQGKYSKTNNSFNFNYRNNKVNVFGSLSGGQYRGFNDLFINRTYKNEDGSIKSYFNQNSQGGYISNYGNSRIGMDYYVSDKTTLGITANGTLSRSSNPVYNISELSDASKNSTGYVLADNSAKDKMKNGGLNLNLRKNLDTNGRNISVDVDYVHYNIRGEIGLVNDIYSSGNEFMSREQLLGRLPAVLDIYSAKTDCTHPFKNGSFSFGAKVSYTDIDNLADYNTVANGVETPDYSKSNHFLYDEMITAAYGNYSKTIKRFSFQAGLRGEGTLSRGNQLGNPVNPRSTFKRDYLAVFPTGYVSYNLDSAASHQLNLAYGRRINRPFFQDLNPFVQPLDKFTFYTGNPLLRPMFSNNVSLTYGWKHYFSATLSYNRTRNEINETLEITADQLYYSRPGNIGRSQNINLSINATIPFAKWLSTTIYSEAANLSYKSQLYTETLNTSGNYLYFYVNNSFLIGKGWSAELSGFYITKALSAQITTLERGSLDIAVQKKILKDKGVLKVSVQDLFYTQINRGIINNLRLTNADYSNRYDTRVVFFTFSYSFGKPFQSAEKRESGAESEKNRVKG